MLKEERVAGLARAAMLYPTSAAYRAELADALYSLDRREEAGREAREALRLDALTPHVDKKLPDALRSSLRFWLTKEGAR